jgi:hypothetical protein
MDVGEGRGLKMGRIKHLKNGKLHSAGGQSAMSLEFCSCPIVFFAMGRNQ